MSVFVAVHFIVCVQYVYFNCKRIQNIISGVKDPERNPVRQDSERSQLYPAERHHPPPHFRSVTHVILTTSATRILLRKYTNGDVDILDHRPYPITIMPQDDSPAQHTRAPISLPHFCLHLLISTIFSYSSFPLSFKQYVIASNIR